MPFRHLKFYDAGGRLLYESVDPKESLGDAYAKAERFGVPVACKAEQLVVNPDRGIMRWLAIVLWAVAIAVVFLLFFV